MWYFLSLELSLSIATLPSDRENLKIEIIKQKVSSDEFWNQKKFQEINI